MNRSKIVLKWSIYAGLSAKFPQGLKSLRQGPHNSFATYTVCTTSMSLTCHFHNITWDNVSCFDSLNALPILSIHFTHFWFIFFKSFNSIFSISFLKHNKNMQLKKPPRYGKISTSDLILLTEIRLESNYWVIPYYGLATERELHFPNNIITSLISQTK